MTAEKKTQMQSISAGVAIGILVIFGGKVIDKMMNTEVLHEIKQDLKEIKQDVNTIKFDYVRKVEYDKDKETMIRIMNKR